MDYFWRTFIIALFMLIIVGLWNEKEFYKDMYINTNNQKEAFISRNRSLEDSNIHLLNICTDSLINK